jgi:hypothetical protein
MTMLAIYVNAENNSNGNPRRGWILTDEQGAFHTFVDEGYQGKGALAAAGFGNVPSTQAIEVKPSFYKELYKQGYGHVESAMKRENRLYRKLR